jgi:cytosine/adenosine deaminase-related metal-dependent hydrolase
MSYLKFSADYIFTGYELITGDDSVLIVHKNGEINAIVSKEVAGDDIQYFQGILTPGLINCHCHLELSHLKNAIPPYSGLIPFLMSVPKLREANYQIIQTAIQEAANELFQSGTVAVGDICNNTTTIELKKNLPLHFYNFIEAIGVQDSNAEARFNLYYNVYNLFQKELSQQSNAIVPHAPYSVSNSLLQKINKESDGKTCCIHNQESLDETKWFLNKEGDLLNLFNELEIDTSSFKPTAKSSLQSYLPYLTAAKNLILVHNTFTTKDDIQFAHEHAIKNQQQLFWCICNNANRYIEQTNPPINELIQQHQQIVIGTDSYSSNWSLNMLDEMKTILLENNNTVSTQDVLTWATINGANALQMDTFLGSFSKGKLPGIVIIDNIENGSISKSSTAKRLL